MRGKRIDELNVGDKAEFSKTVSESDVYLYAGITGDFNPAHLNQPYAEATPFKTRIAHGMLSAGFISTLLGMHLPGPGTIYLRQELQFTAPVAIGDTVTARVTVEEIHTKKKRVKLKTQCFKQDGAMVIDGHAVVIPPKQGFRQP